MSAATPGKTRRARHVCGSRSASVYLMEWSHGAHSMNHFLTQAGLTRIIVQRCSATTTSQRSSAVEQCPSGNP